MLTTSFNFQTYTPGSDDPCAWYAAHNPIIASALRTDESWTADANSAGNTKLTLAHPTPGAMNAGDLIYFNNPSNPTQNGTYALTANVASGANNLTINCPYVASASTIGSYINYITLYKNYYIKAVYLKADPTVLPTLTVYPFGSPTRHIPNAAGFAKIDVSAIVKNGVSMTDPLINHSGFVNIRDYYLSAIFDIAFLEEYTLVGVGQEVDDVGSPYILYICNAAMQLQQSKYGGNLADFMPEEEGVVPALFQSDFKRPTFWQNWPWDISFLYSKSLADNVNSIIGGIPTIYRVVDDMASNNLSADVLASGQKYSQNRLLLPGSYATNVIQLYLSAKYIP